MNNQKLKISEETKKVFHVQINSGLLKFILSIPKVLSDEAHFLISQNGIEIISFDSGNTALVKINVDENVFESYKATKFRLDIDLVRINRILKIMKNTDLIDIRLDHNQLIFQVDQLKIKTSILYHKEMLDPNIDILKESGSIVLKVGVLKRILLISNDISDHIKLGIDTNKFELMSKNEVTFVEQKMKQQDVDKLECQNYHKSSYYIPTLLKLINCLPNESSLIRIRFGDCTLIRLDYDYKGIHLKFFLAPRMDEC